MYSDGLSLRSMLRYVAVTQAAALPIQKVKWNQEEDQRLIDAVAVHGTDSWTQISARVPGRSSKQCRERWLGQLSPFIHKNNWTVEEDALLYRAQSIHGNKWTMIAQFLPGRSSICVKNRWTWLVRRGFAPPRPLTPAPQRPARMRRQQPIKPKAIAFDSLLNGEDLFGLPFREFQAKMLGRPVCD
jgi:hypothetical protein